MDGLNSLGETASKGFFDSLVSALPVGARAVADTITAVRGGSGATPTAQELAAIEAARQAEESRRMQQYLIYGGVAIGAIALIMYMRKR
jgi:hypothetical protein